MLKLRAILLPILMVCMFTQPFCCHCFAQMRAMTKYDESEKQKKLEGDADSFPVENSCACMKKPGLSTSKIDLDPLIYRWLVEAVSPCFTSVDTNILSEDNARCPAWLRLSVLLI